MQITHPHTLLTLAWLAIGQLCTGCSAEDMTGEAPSEMGVLCLQMSSDEVFIETRADNDYVWAFQITGDNYSNNNVELGKDISIPAGQYTFSATNAEDEDVENGYGGPLYEGSIRFGLEVGEHKTIELDLGSPKNAKVTIKLSEGFTKLYTLDELTLNDGTRNNTITPRKQVAYFPATNTTLSYTLVANANKNSHVQDITGAKGTVTIAPGTHTTLTLDVNPIDPNLVKIVTGTPYNGEFQ